MNGELESLLNRAVDGLASVEEEARVAELLRGDAGMRGDYRRFMELHSALYWDYAAAAIPKQAIVDAPPRRRLSLWMVWAAAAVVMMGALIWTMPTRSIVTLSQVSGAVSWNGNGTQMTGLQNSMSLREGTITLEGETASAQLSFKDGSVIALNGETELMFSDAGQKRLMLKRGSLTAEVKPQPQGRPMLIRTPSAEAEVVGTEFAMSTSHSDTSLNVETGRVSLRRLADDRVVEVGSREGAIASLDAGAQMSVTKPGLPPSQWRRSLDAPAPERWRGRWLAASDGQPARMEAMPYIANRKKDGSPLIFRGISFRTESDPSRSFVSISPQSMLHLRFRVSKPGPVTVFLSCTKDGGGFGGNFESRGVHPQSTGPEWQEVDFPISEFRPVMTSSPPSLAGKQVFLLLIHSGTRDIGLEIARASIQ